MSAPPKEGPSFSPDNLRVIAIVYDTVLRRLGADVQFLTQMPAERLRHQLASLLVVEASRGPIEAKRLESAVVTSLRVLAGCHIDALLAVD